MATGEQINFNEPHPPKENGIEAFNIILPTIKSEIVKSRRHWDKHEPRMWSRVTHLSDDELVAFAVEEDLVEIRSGATSYGTIILGKIRVPGVNDEQGEGYIHVRIHDPPNRVSPTPSLYSFAASISKGTEDIIFHSLFTDEGHPDADGRPTTWRAVQTREAPLEFFNE